MLYRVLLKFDRDEDYPEQFNIFNDIVENRKHATLPTFINSTMYKTIRDLYNSICLIQQYYNYIYR